MLGFALNSLVTSVSNSLGVDAKIKVKLLMIVSAIDELVGRLCSDVFGAALCVCRIEKVK